MGAGPVPRIVVESREPPQIVVDPDRIPEIPEEALVLEAQLEEESSLYNGHTYRLLGWNEEPFRLTLGVTRYFHYLAVKGLARSGLGRA